MNDVYIYNQNFSPCSCVVSLYNVNGVLLPESSKGFVQVCSPYSPKIWIYGNANFPCETHDFDILDDLYCTYVRERRMHSVLTIVARRSTFHRSRLQSDPDRNTVGSQSGRGWIPTETRSDRCRIATELSPCRGRIAVASQPNCSHVMTRSLLRRGRIAVASWLDRDWSWREGWHGQPD